MAVVKGPKLAELKAALKVLMMVVLMDASMAG